MLKPWMIVVYWLVSHGLLSLVCRSRVAPPTIAEAFTSQPLIKKMLNRLAYCSLLWGAFSQLRGPLLR